VSRDLQQPVSFRPFMRQLIAFLLVTGRAGKHYIVDIMTWSKVSTRNGNSMLKMIDRCSILAQHKSAKAVIAGVFLCFQLGLDLLICQCACDISFAGTPSLLPYSSPYKHFFMVNLAVSTDPGLYDFRVFLVVFALSDFLLFTMFFSIAFMTCVSTLFAVRMQQSLFSIFMEKLSSSRKPLQAIRIGALFLRESRGIIHGLNCLSFSVPCVFRCQAGKATRFS
jgi:hypothetical protein